MLQTTKTPGTPTLTAAAIALFLTTEGFGKTLKTIGTETTLVDERKQLERQAFVNSISTQRVQRAGGWLAIDATIVHNQPVTPLSDQLAGTITAMFNGCGQFGSSLNEQDVRTMLTHMNTTVAFTGGRARRRLMTTALATNKDDLDGLARYCTELTLQVALWSNRTTADQIRGNTKLETQVLQVAERVIKANNADGVYGRLVPGLLITDINTNGPTQGRRNN